MILFVYVFEIYDFFIFILSYIDYEKWTRKLIVKIYMKHVR